MTSIASNEVRFEINEIESTSSWCAPMLLPEMGRGLVGSPMYLQVYSIIGLSPWNVICFSEKNGPRFYKNEKYDLFFNVETFRPATKFTIEVFAECRMINNGDMFSYPVSPYPDVVENELPLKAYERARIHIELPIMRLLPSANYVFYVYLLDQNYIAVTGFWFNAAIVDRSWTM